MLLREYLTQNSLFLLPAQAIINNSQFFGTKKISSLLRNGLEMNAPRHPWS
jgi:hypothetical protein